MLLNGKYLKKSIKMAMGALKFKETINHFF